MANTDNITLLKKSKPSRDCLVFIRTGDTAQFDYWDRQFDRTWDVAISSFGDADKMAGQFRDAEYILAGGRSKFQAFKQFYQQVEAVRDYRCVMLLDDDVEMEYPALKEFLEIHQRRELGLSQPALTHDSHVSWEITSYCPSFLLRYTNFVEVMAPCFSRDALAQVIHTFDESISSWGLDILWPRLLEDFRIAIVDECTLRHMRPVDREGGNFYKYLATLGIDPKEEARALYRKYGIDSIRVQTHDVVARIYRPRL